MNESSKFGLMVAYLLPGFIGLAGIAPFAPAVAAWLQPTTQASASLGPPVYAALAAITIGMILSCFRWLLIDQIHHRTGIVPPVWDDRRLEQRLAAFNYLVESHYRYYQFVANSLVAVLAAYGVNRWMGTTSLLGVGTDLAVFVLCAALFAASRNALTNYYTRTGRLVGRIAEKGSGDTMYNGNDHQVEHKPAPTPPPPAEQKSTKEVPPERRQEQIKATTPGRPTGS